jgi:pyroglutamyl-peptidase
MPQSPSKLPPSQSPPPTPRILVTGFGPFLTHEYNPSWEVAQSFSAALGETCDCRCECVDVTFEAAREFSRRVFEPIGKNEKDAPRLVIHFGLSAKSEAVRFERFAYNRRGQTPDHSESDAAYDFSDVLEADGPADCETSIDVARLVELFAESPAAANSEFHARTSRDPGDYVCNAIYYHSLRAARRARRPERPAHALFIHVPTLAPEPAAQLGRTVADCVARYLGDGA